VRACRLQQDLDLGRKLLDAGTLEAITCTADATAQGFVFPCRWSDIQAYLTKLEEPWLTTLLRRGWRIGPDAAPGAVHAVDRVLNMQHGIGGVATGDVSTAGEEDIVNVAVTGMNFSRFSSDKAAPF
jgi:hypothetical protein